MTRICFTTRIDPARADEYKAAHAAVWPEMLAALKSTGWNDYSLFLRPDGLLVGYLICEDFPAAQRAMELQEVNARWQAAMGDFFLAGDDVRPDETFVVLEEVFHLEDQIAATETAG
ncbi:L-rhamnose mutarotase [Nakamurella silvestris]|nr:L-rhamnose mutarotase [Nakamurella silvestris]